MRSTVIVLALLAFASQAAADQTRVRDAEWNAWWSTSGTFENPSTIGHYTSWAEWVVTAVRGWDVTQGLDVALEGFAFPCAGGEAHWGLWIDDYSSELPDDPFNPQYAGTFTPIVADGTASPPYPYTYVELPEPLIFFGDYWIIIAYENPGRVGYSQFNQTVTWSWWSGHWENDSWGGEAADLQILASLIEIPTAESSWSAIKGLY